MAITLYMHAAAINTHVYSIFGLVVTRCSNRYPTYSQSCQPCATKKRNHDGKKKGISSKKKGIHKNETYNHARHTSNAEIFIHPADFSIQAGNFCDGYFGIIGISFFLENIFLLVCLKLVFYWICDQIAILGQLFDVWYVKKK